MSGQIIDKMLYDSSILEIKGVPVNRNTRLKSLMTSIRDFTKFVSLFFKHCASSKIQIPFVYSLMYSTYF